MQEEENTFEDDQEIQQRVQAILENHQRDMQEIKRDGTRMALILCPLIALVFGWLAYYDFTWGNPTLGVISAIGALAFLLVLVGKVLFD